MDGASLLGFKKPPLSPYFPKRPCLLPSSSLHYFSLPLPVVRAESQAEKAGTSSDERSVSVPSPPTKPSGKGTGFSGVSNSKKKRGSKDRGSVIRRSPIERPSLLYPDGEGRRPPPQQEQQNANESSFLLTWLGLGFLILVEGIALAASGFLPEEWDNFFVKYLYPSFTPTVFLFVGGRVAYGVLKYLQGEQMKS